jgi:hypothetical protein
MLYDNAITLFFRLKKVNWNRGTTIVIVIILTIVIISEGLHSDTDLYIFYTRFYPVVVINILTASLF